MKCGSCFYEFREADAGKWFAPLTSFGGGTLKCPRCGFEMRPMPNLKALFKKFGKRKADASR